MNNSNLQAPAGQGLGGANLVEMKKEELRDVEGGYRWLGRLIKILITEMSRPGAREEFAAGFAEGSSRAGRNFF